VAIYKPGAQLRDSPTRVGFEDEEDVATYLKTVYQDNGWTVEWVDNGVAAMESLKRERPDLISLDINLPQKTGVKVYREVKENLQYASIPVVMVTGVPGQFETFISTRKQVPPPEGYVSKPIDIDKLVEVVKKLL